MTVSLSGIPRVVQTQGIASEDREEHDEHNAEDDDRYSGRAGK